MTNKINIKLIEDNIEKAIKLKDNIRNYWEFSFNELGLDSFDLIEITKLIKQNLGIEIDITIFFNYTTPKSLIEYLIEKSNCN